MLTAMRSFRTMKRMPLIRFDQPNARIRTELVLDEHSSMVDIHLSRVLRKAFVDEAPVEKFTDFLGKFPTVTFSSEDIQLLRGAPALRRRFFDLVLSFGEPFYLETLRKYHHTLKQRNALLKVANPYSQIAAFDQFLAAQACRLTQLRLELLEDFNQHLKMFYTKISDTLQETPDLKYSQYKPLHSEEDFLNSLKRHLERDLSSGSTSIGPHRDDYMFLLNDRPAFEYASEGQQRAWVLSLRFAQFSYFNEKSRTTPILLADDILGELDPARRERFWSAIPPDTQVIATGTSLPQDIVPWQTFAVQNGVFS